MLTTNCIHPELLRHLSLCGHGSKILIADGNYPLFQRSGSAPKVFLGLCPGLPNVTDVLSALLSVIQVEGATVMRPDDGSRPDIFDAFEQALPGISLERLDRYGFYDACGQDGALALAISTGEQRTYANLLLTVGCA